MVKTLYIDESGYTGHNYLDPDQPIFALASTDINPDDAENILKQSFPKYKGKEFKLTNIWDSSNQQGLIDFSKLVGKHPSTTFGYFVNKDYLVLIHMIEWLIEPHQSRAGLDFYADGYCRKLTNYLYYLLTEIEPVDFLHEMIKDYQIFSRKPNLVSLEELKFNLQKYSERVQHPVGKKIITDMAISSEHLPKYTNLDDFKSTNELHLTTFLACVSWWRKNFSEDFRIVHDISSNFSRQKEVWENITSSNVAPYLHPLGDGTFVQYPLRVIETISQDSESNYSIQFCDIISGLCTKYLDTNIMGDKRKFLMELMQGGMSKLLFTGLRPEKDFPKGPPQKRTGPDAVDLLSGHIKT